MFLIMSLKCKSHKLEAEVCVNNALVCVFRLDLGYMGLRCYISHIILVPKLCIMYKMHLCLQGKND